MDPRPILSRFAAANPQHLPAALKVLANLQKQASEEVLSVKVKRVKTKLYEAVDSLAECAEQAEAQGYPRELIRRLEAAQKLVAGAHKETVLARRALGKIER